MTTIDYERIEKNCTSGNPKDNASVLSMLFFWWMNDTFRTGSKRQLENSDLFPLCQEDETQGNTERLSQLWTSEAAKDGRWKLLKALLKAHPLCDYIFILGSALLGAICQTLQPLFLSFLLGEIIGSSGASTKWAYLYGTGVCLSCLLRATILHQFMYNAWLMSMRWKVATTGLIFNKVLRLGQSSLADVTTGYITNLVSGDLQRFEQILAQVCFLIQGIVEILLATGLVCYLIGYMAGAGILFMLVLLVYYVTMGSACAQLRMKTAKVTDRRLGIINAVIFGIRAVKMYAWEWPFRENIDRARREEIGLTRVKSAILASFAALLYSSQSVASFLSLLVLMLAGIPLTPYRVFMVLSLINTIRVSVSANFSTAVYHIADFSTSLRRIGDFLQVKELPRLTSLSQHFTPTRTKGDHNENKISDIDDEVFIDGGSVDKIAEIRPKLGPQPSSSDVLMISNVTSLWNCDERTVALKDLTLNISKRELVIVTGPVGSGKSALLCTILGELNVVQGRVSNPWGVAFVSQCPWVFTGTIRENILFGKTFHEARYQAAIRSSQLDDDLESFPDGDSTMIGERGVVLSGGQRSRVGLARAVYRDADLYLLDDPLSAVDARVGKQLFEDCICGILADKTCILVTHQLQHMEGADHIVVMNAGAVIAEGSYEKLTQEGIEFEQMVARYDESSGEKSFEQSLSDLEESEQEEEEEEFKGLRMHEEDRATGVVSWGLYWKYFRAGLSVPGIVAVAALLLLVQVALVCPDWWLLVVSREATAEKLSLKTFHIYGGLVGGAFVLTIVRSVLFFQASLGCSQNLHDRMTAAVLKAPVLFFDSNRIGRILNRFSKDICSMDELLPDVFFDAIQLVLFCSSALILPVVLNPWVLLPACPLLVMFVWLGRYYVKTSREIKRLEAINRSPVFTHFSDTLEGLVTIRSFSMQNEFREEFYRCQDNHSRSWFVVLTSVRWLGIRLDFMCVLFLAATVFGALVAQIGAGLTALSIIYVVQLAVDTSQYGVRQCAEVENYMTSVERVITYTELSPETGYSNQTQAPQDWPSEGQVTVKDLSIVYYTGGPKILKNLNFTIGSGEKIGLAGRTGAGKSSLVSALFRMPEPSGQIIIDHVNILSLNLQRARRGISVIIQDPILFNGSLRMNLDPFERYEDRDIWLALEGASLKTMVESLPEQLSQEVTECGSNFSVGERQLICLARALLQRNKVILMDEATANVDYRTDKLIHNTIRTQFQDCTVITVAHRLNTILDYDRVMVLDDGQIVEFDSPEVLLKKDRGVLAGLYYSQHGQRQNQE